MSTSARARVSGPKLVEAVFVETEVDTPARAAVGGDVAIEVLQRDQQRFPVGGDREAGARVRSPTPRHSRRPRSLLPVEHAGTRSLDCSPTQSNRHRRAAPVSWQPSKYCAASRDDRNVCGPVHDRNWEQTVARDVEKTAVFAEVQLVRMHHAVRNGFLRSRGP